jgi:hypothetical protein
MQEKKLGDRAKIYRRITGCENGTNSEQCNLFWHQVH